MAKRTRGNLLRRAWTPIVWIAVGLCAVAGGAVVALEPTTCSEWCQLYDQANAEADRCARDLACDYSAAAERRDEMYQRAKHIDGYGPHELDTAWILPAATLTVIGLFAIAISALVLQERFRAGA